MYHITNNMFYNQSNFYLASEKSCTTIFDLAITSLYKAPSPKYPKIICNLFANISQVTCFRENFRKFLHLRILNYGFNESENCRGRNREEKHCRLMSWLPEKINLRLLSPNRIRGYSESYFQGTNFYL